MFFSQQFNWQYVIIDPDGDFAPNRRQAINLSEQLMNKVY